MAAPPLLFNCDFGGMFWNPELWRTDPERYTAGAIHKFVDNLADQGVNTLVVNPNTKVAWYPSRAVPTVLDGYKRNDPEHFKARNPDCYWFRPDFLDPYLDLAEAGVDWLEEAITASHRRGLTAWISVRMNDPHHGANPADPMNPPELTDAALQLGGREANPDCSYEMATQGLNYARPEVRDYMLRMIRELVGDYDADGLQLDWLRVPACCPPGADATTIEMMSEWFRAIRRLCDERAVRSGRPFPLGMRVPGNYRMLKHIGIDVAGLVQEGVLDFICASNFMQTAWDLPHDRLRRELGPNLQIFGVTELIFSFLWSRIEDAPTGRYLCAHPPALRANVAGKLVLGADGIEVFNFFVGDLSRRFQAMDVRSQYPALRNLTALEQLRGQEKHYALPVAGRYCWAPPFDRAECLPATLCPQDRLTLRLPMSAEPADGDLELVVQVIMEAGPPNDQDMGVSLNGAWPNQNGQGTDQLLFPIALHATHITAHRACNFTFPVAAIVEGWNEIVICNGAREDPPPGQSRSPACRVVGVELAVQARSRARI